MFLKWAIEFARENPQATVIGVDLSPIQPADAPANCTFRVGNVDTDWIEEEKYDLIHSRAMLAAFRSWPKYLERAFEYVKKH